MDNITEIIFILLDIIEDSSSAVKIFMNDGDAFSHKENVARILTHIKDLQHYVDNEKEGQRYDYNITFKKSEELVTDTCLCGICLCLKDHKGKDCDSSQPYYIKACYLH